jgi:hypothetical protein
MKNKGQINWVFLSAIIAVVLLLLIFLGPMKGLGKIQNFFDNTPGFNESSKEPMKIGIVRYDVEMDKVQQYDGERWNDVSSSATFEGLSKPTSESELNQIFEDYYFNGKRNESKQVLKNSNYLVSVSGLAKSTSPKYESKWYEASFTGGNLAVFTDWISNNPTYFDSVDYNRGTIILNIWKLKSDGNIDSIAGFIFVDPRGNLNSLDGATKIEIQQTTSDASSKTDFLKSIFGESPSFTSNEQTNIQSSSIAWRDSVFKNTTIMVQNTKFCIKKVGASYLSEGRYIVVDLNKAGDKCNV